MNNVVIQDQLDGKIPVPGKTGIDWYFFCWFLEKYKGTNMLEVGAGDGGSTLSMASYAGQLTVIDSWHQNWPKQSVESLTQHYHLPVNYIDKKSQDVDVQDLPNFTFTHLDANKNYQDIIQDLNLFGHVSKIMCVDDYLQSMWPEVTWAVDDWLKDSGWHRVLIGNHQVFLSAAEINIKQLIVDWPLINRGHGWHLTYGCLPKDQLIKKFIDSGDMEYTWQRNQYR